MAELVVTVATQYRTKATNSPKLRQFNITIDSFLRQYGLNTIFD